MKETLRKDLLIIRRYANIPSSTIKQALEDNVYASKQNWHKFLKFLFLTLAIGFLVTGIIFFFAYNWDDLNKFVKLGIIQALLIAGTIFIVIGKSPPPIKNIVLTGLSMLVGALFAVFGQIYQTGANAYDFFLGWTVFITVWVIVTNYTPLWLIYSILLNTTFFFFSQQVAYNWSDTTIVWSFILINLLMLLTFLFLEKYKTNFSLDNWFYDILKLAIASCCTIAIILLKESDNVAVNIISFIAIAAIYLIAIKQSKNDKSIYNLALITLSIIISIIYYLIIHINEEIGILMIGLFSVIAFTVSTKILLDIQKKWNHGK